MASMQKITPFLWFNNEAEEAAKHYVAIFKDSSIGHVTRYPKEGQEVHGRPEGSVMVVEFRLAGQTFTALNGGPHFKFNEAVSFVVNCDSQEEVDYYWEKLAAGGDPRAQQCGWLKDKYGLSWQVVATPILNMLKDADKAKSGRVMGAVMQMKKMDIAAAQRAYERK